MATSGSIDFSLTAREVIIHALRLIRVQDAVSDASGADASNAMQTLNLMLKGWQHNGPDIFRITNGSVTLVSATSSYALSPQPYRVIEARYRDASGRDLPMIELGRLDYQELPLKSAAGIPTQFYVDVQRTATTLYTWPVLATATTETIKYTYQRRFEDVDALDNEIDVPQEHLEMVSYSLADRLMDFYGMDNGRITQRAMMLYQKAIDAEREPFVQFVPMMR